MKHESNFTINRFVLIFTLVVLLAFAGNTVSAIDQSFVPLKINSSPLNVIISGEGIKGGLSTSKLTYSVPDTTTNDTIKKSYNFVFTPKTFTYTPKTFTYTPKTFTYTPKTYNYIPNTLPSIGISNDPDVVVKNYYAGTSLIEVSYPRAVSPVIIYKNGNPKNYRWKYTITVTDRSGLGFSLLQRARAYVSGDGSVYSSSAYSIPLESFEHDVEPYGAFSDSDWVQNSFESDIFFGGSVDYTYYGQNAYGTSFQIPVHIHLNNP